MVYIIYNLLHDILKGNPVVTDYGYLKVEHSTKMF